MRVTLESGGGSQVIDTTVPGADSIEQALTLVTLVLRYWSEDGDMSAVDAKRRNLIATATLVLESVLAEIEATTDV